MSRKKIKLVGDTFTHLSNGNLGYSVSGKMSKKIEWVKERTGITVYVDGWTQMAFDDDSDDLKIAWLLESKQIIPRVIDSIKNNPYSYIEKFDMILTHDQDLLRIDKKFKWVPAQGFWIKSPKIYEKTKLVSMISSNKKMCSGHLDRLVWVEIFRNRVDLYGRGFNEIASKEEGLCDYMFSVAIENGSYETYFTEKILDCFATGTIPVYLGAPDIANHFNADGILSLEDFDTLSPELYYSKIDAIIDNLERAKKMEVTEDFIYSNYLEDIC